MIDGSARSMGLEVVGSKAMAKLGKRLKQALKAIDRDTAL